VQLAAATPPLVDGKLVIAFVGGHDSCALMAFNAETGKTAWKWSGDGPRHLRSLLISQAPARL